MRLLLLILIFIGCESGLTDLTPNTEFTSEIAFNVVLFNEVIQTTNESQDTGWHIVEETPIWVPSPFEDSVQYVSTDTFTFNWEDYEPVLQTVHRIANNFDITFTTVDSRYTWIPNMYSTREDYLIPLFNKDGSRYWLQVFKQREGLFQTYYTARGIWAISKPKKINGDVS